MYSTALTAHPSSTSPSLCNHAHLMKSASQSHRILCLLHPFKLTTHFPRNPKPISHASYSFNHFSISPTMQMQDSTVKMEVDVPVSVAYNCYSDRQSIPQWMPFISSVKVLEDKPDLSRWTLKYTAFGRDIEFSWLARNLQPIPNKKIHWRSLEGLPNSGAVRFFPKGPSSCLIELTVSYEVPQILVPVASALQPFLQSLLLRGLERFSNFAKSRLPDTTS